MSYDKDTGLFTRRKGVRGGLLGGKVGYKKPNGYIGICIDYERYLAHRLAWFYVHKEWPKNQIDHINGVRDDNRMENLRDATHAENQHHRFGPQRNNKSSKYLGVRFFKQTNRWTAVITVRNKGIRLGYFGTEEEAYAAYLKAKKKYHPFATISKAD
jgi:hypothetical protein